MTMNFIQWNCNGLLSHLCEFQLLVNEYRPSAIAIQETRFYPLQPFTLRNYNVHRKDVHSNTIAKGGVALMTHKDILVSTIILTTDLQAVAVRIHNPRQLTLCSLYLPDRNWNRDELADLIQQLPPPLLLMGDLNSYNTLWGSRYTNSQGRAIESLLDEYNLIILNTGEDTHYISASGTFSSIDLSFCSPSTAQIFDWKPLDDLYGSDHYPLVISNGQRQPDRYRKTKWRLDTADWDAFREIISLPIGGANSSIDATSDEISEAILIAANKTIRKTSAVIQRKSVPWWNDEVSSAIRQKKSTLKVFKSSPTMENHISFKKSRAQARRIIRAAKAISWKKYVSTIDMSTNIAEVWRKTRTISGSSNPPASIALIQGDCVIDDPQDVAELLAVHFASVSSNENYEASFRKIKRDLETPLDFATDEDLSYNSDLTIEELEYALIRSKDSAPGPDDIPTAMLKNLPCTEKQKLLMFLNMIWKSSSYPTKWRNATVIPILKSGKDRKEATSYRPISLTCCMSRILESIINYRLMWILETRNLIAKEQCGFRKFHSTTDNLVYLENAIQNAFINQENLVAVSFDIEKAFDMTWRYGILQQIYEWGIRGNLPKFIESFLLERRFSVRVGDRYSSTFTLANGVAQGSPISVTLFLIAMNRVIEAVQSRVRKCAYVDDLVIYITGKDMPTMEHKLQTSIDDLDRVAIRRGFRFSQEKTICIQFTRSRPPYDKPNLHLRHKPITLTEEARFLGVIFDKKLNWKSHITEIISKCRKSLNIIRCMAHINWGSNRETLIELYRSLTLSKLEYGAVVYGSAKRTTLVKLDALHHNGLRIAIGAFPTSPAKSICCDAGLAPLAIRRGEQELRYAASLRAKINHLNYAIFAYPLLWKKYIARPATTRPLSIRVKEQLNSRNQTFFKVLRYGFNKFPPWQIPNAVTHTELTEHKKDDTPTAVYSMGFRRLINQYENAMTIFTDGSKNDHGVGCAVVTEAGTQKWSLPPSTSIYTAELFAINRALELILASPTNSSTALICSDSLSAICKISRKISNDPLIQLIMDNLWTLNEKNKQVVFVWTPGHTGIKGNNEADKAAKEAAVAKNVTLESVRPADLILEIKNMTREKWQSDWNNKETKLKQIKPLVGKWPMPPSIARREMVALARLRIGHTRLTHSYLFESQEPPICQMCNVQLTVRHVLETCLRYKRERDRAKLETRIELILGPKSIDIKKVIMFCKNAKLLHQI